MAICLEKPLLVYGHSSLSTVILRDNILDKIQNFKSDEISDNKWKTAWPRMNLGWWSAF